MNILFICKHNRFRSKVAEALFKKYNKNKNIKVKSAGVDLDYLPVARSVINMLRGFGIREIDRNPHKLTKKLIEWSDLIVIAANNVSKNKIEYQIKKIDDERKRKIVKWIIYDTKQNNLDRILEISEGIDKKVRKLVRRLK